MKRYLQALWDKAEEVKNNNILSMLEYNPDAVLLDCGCGDGELTLKVASKIGTQNVFGIEIAKELVNKAKQKEINVKQADLNKGGFPFDSESIDVVCANQVIEHLYNTDNFISEIYRLLSRRGYAVISTENLTSWHNIASLFFG